MKGSSRAPNKPSPKRAKKLTEEDVETEKEPIRLDERFRDLIEGRVEQWKEQLMDLSRRNNLLFFRETKTQHVDLLKADRGELAKLLSGETVSVDMLFTVPGEISHAADDAKRRFKSVLAKSIENYEERSLDTLSIGIGEFSWDYEEGRASSDSASVVEKKAPRAPILLVPVEVKRGQKKGDFTVAIDPSEAEINPVLQYVLYKDHGLELKLPEAGDQQPDFSLNDKIDRLKPVLESAPNGVVKSAVQLSNFSYAKLAMVQDLDQGIDAMTTHQIILAIADNQDALNAIRGNLTDPPLDDPNYISPENEFLILDADSSQNMVINAILKGQTFAFDGPPGTGKSQTIANAIAVLIANKKKVLFVAEKRAAIDAVMKRLEHVGLSELVMDFHGTSKKKKDLLDSLRTAYNVIQTIDVRRTFDESAEFRKTREMLVGQSRELHSKRDPWKLSIYEMLSIRGKYRSGETTQFRFQASTLDRFLPDDVTQVESQISSMWNLGGFVDTLGARHWRAAKLRDEEQADRLIDVLSDASHWKITDIKESLNALADSIGVTNLNVAQLRNLTGLAVEARELQSTWGCDLLWGDIENISRQLAGPSSSLGRRFASIFSNEFKTGLREFRRLTGGKAKVGLIIREVERADQVLRFWASGYGGANSRIPDFTESREVSNAQNAVGELTILLNELEPFSDLVAALLEDFEAAVSLINELLANRNIATGSSQSNQIEEELCSRGFERLILEARTAKIGLDSIIERLWYAWSHALIERVGSKTVYLNEHSSTAFQSMAARFKELDRKHIDFAPERIKSVWAQNAAEAWRTHSRELGALQNAFNRKRKLPPMTQLFKQSKNCVSAIKPCWVMSPLSVSMLRPPCEWFDVVIFDEASQILPADSITSIKAAKQVVVAGDDRQLPPTSFFASGNPTDDEGVDDMEYADDIQVGNYESILALMKSIVTKPRQLQWHYRSRDERLIAFSNQRIYKSLVTFPNSDQIDTLNFVHAGSGPEAVSKGATNTSEVRKVVELVKEHARLRPTESLGVIALGSPHANAIDHALNEARSNDLQLDDFMDSHPDERFFVKNLERVQGDERDAIILTVGYGRNDKGEMRYNFGPINGKHGERRLNVATTRAKQRMTLVATFTELDLDKNQCASGGMPFFRDYIGYVRSGGENFGDTNLERPEINAFERSIQERLERAGLQLVPQYGVGKYRIDFAVRDPRDPSVFALAIECDGASYHSQPTARERDRLRQELLEGRGWKFHRIWSTDWFRDPDKEVKRCLLALEEATHQEIS